MNPQTQIKSVIAKANKLDEKNGEIITTKLFADGSSDVMTQKVVNADAITTLTKQIAPLQKKIDEINASIKTLS